MGNMPSAPQIQSDMTVTTVTTSPISGQVPGTSGLRKKTKVFQEPNYLQNFVASVFNSLDPETVKGGTLVVSGDGRFFNDQAIQIIIKMAAAQGVANVWCGTGGLLSTPAVSAVIRTRSRGLDGMAPFGGFILSASHNPGGPDEDFGIKYNGANGGPAPEKATKKMAEGTTTITSFPICNGIPKIDFSKPASFDLGTAESPFTVTVFDCVEDHVALLKQVFDFGKIKALVARKDFSMVYDSMYGVQGPYAKRIFVDELGAPASSCLNANPSPTFGPKHDGHSRHADPNLTQATELVALMGLDKNANPIRTNKEPPSFGAAADGDADRNMIMGARFFCSPSDSLAVIVANATCIPYYRNGVKGCARSMPTSCALDLVAKDLNIPYFEVPTGWKFFGNLMDSATEAFPKTAKYTPFICGEESFGTGGDHVREKDGMWAVLAWLQILAAKNPDPTKPLIGVEDVCKAHWAKYGRNYYARYDYEGIAETQMVNGKEKNVANIMMDNMVAAQPKLIGTVVGGMKIAKADMFAYTDAVEKAHFREYKPSENQGVRFIFEDGSRFVFRLSGTGASGATIRMYLEKYASPSEDLAKHPFEVVKPIAEIALQISQLSKITGRTEPSVIT